MSYAGICGKEHTEQSKDQVKISVGRKGKLGVEGDEQWTSRWYKIARGREESCKRFDFYLEWYGKSLDAFEQKNLMI